MSKIRLRNGVTEKLCSTCKAWKPLSDFSPGGKSHQTASEGVFIASAAIATRRGIGAGMQRRWRSGATKLKPLVQKVVKAPLVPRLPSQKEVKPIPPREIAFPLTANPPAVSFRYSYSGRSMQPATVSRCDSIRISAPISRGDSAVAYNKSNDPNLWYSSLQCGACVPYPATKLASWHPWNVSPSQNCRTDRSGCMKLNWMATGHSGSTPTVK
jgi:hypothetical protein